MTQKQLWAACALLALAACGETQQKGQYGSSSGPNPNLADLQARHYQPANQAPPASASGEDPVAASTLGQSDEAQEPTQAPAEGEQSTRTG